MSGIPVVISENGFGTPVRPVDSNAPVMTVAENGYGMPVVISDLGAPFIVQGLFNIDDLFALTSDDDGEILVGDDGEALAVTQQTIETVEALWS